MQYEKRRIYTGLIIFVSFFFMAGSFLLWYEMFSIPNMFYALIAAIMMYFMWYFVYPYVVRRYQYEDIKTTDG